MELFHGTKKNFADSMKNKTATVDVTKGGGELGRGFYLGDNMSMAITWAKGRYKNPAVLEFNTDKRKYAQLALKQMSHAGILHTWHQLKRTGIHRTFIFKMDVVFGPLATSPFAAQYKFESKTAEGILNASSIDRIL